MNKNTKRINIHTGKSLSKYKNLKGALNRFKLSHHKRNREDKIKGPQRKENNSLLIT